MSCQTITACSFSCFWYKFIQFFKWSTHGQSKPHKHTHKFFHYYYFHSFSYVSRFSFRIFLEYGRGCQDIGCLPSEVCVMSQDACNLGQRDGKDCGTYPTCKKQAGAGSTNTNRGQGKIRFLWFFLYTFLLFCI